MKVKEVIVGLSGVLPNASYSNYKPNYSITMEVQDGDDVEGIIAKARGDLRGLFRLDEEAAKVDLIESQYASIRFREKDGKKYPSVTSILGWDTEWPLTQDQLNQYGSRGNIIHFISEQFLLTGKWLDPMDIPDLQDDVATVLGGSLKLHWNNCTHEKFFEVHGKDIEVEATEQVVFNEELQYCGRLDVLGSYKGLKTVFDNKSGSVYDFRQLAAYAVCVPDVLQLAICPVGKTDNKSGFMKIKTTTDIGGEMKGFVKAREKFKQRFGI